MDNGINFGFWCSLIENVKGNVEVWWVPSRSHRGLLIVSLSLSGHRLCWLLLARQGTVLSWIIIAANMAAPPPPSPQHKPPLRLALMILKPVRGRILLRERQCQTQSWRRGINEGFICPLTDYEKAINSRHSLNVFYNATKAILCSWCKWFMNKYLIYFPYNTFPMSCLERINKLKGLLVYFWN